MNRRSEDRRTKQLRTAWLARFQSEHRVADRGEKRHAKGFFVRTVWPKGKPNSGTKKPHAASVAELKRIMVRAYTATSAGLAKWQAAEMERRLECHDALQVASDIRKSGVLGVTRCK